MATKTNKVAAKSKPAAKPAGKMVASFPEGKDPEKEKAYAAMALMPSVNAALVLETYTKATLGEQSLAALMESVSEGMEEVSAGNLKRAEAMLFGQAQALQAVFMTLARRAASQEYLKQWEAYMRMALKAQNQCRMTLETLALVKNPPIVIAKQANINNGGQQQVNNGQPGSTVPASAHVPGVARGGASESPGSLALEADADPTRRLSPSVEGVAQSSQGVPR